MILRRDRLSSRTRLTGSRTLSARYRGEVLSETMQRIFLRAAVSARQATLTLRRMIGHDFKKIESTLQKRRKKSASKVFCIKDTACETLVKDSQPLAVFHLRGACRGLIHSTATLLGTSCEYRVSNKAAAEYTECTDTAKRNLRVLLQRHGGEEDGRGATKSLLREPDTSDRRQFCAR